MVVQLATPGVMVRMTEDVLVSTIAELDVMICMFVIGV